MSMTRGLPVAGYTDQPNEAINQVNENKVTEERILRVIDTLSQQAGGDPRCLALARTHIETGFMWLNRAIFRPERVKLGDDPGPVSGPAGYGPAPGTF
jgi:hypothetical protein